MAFEPEPTFVPPLGKTVIGFLKIELKCLGNFLTKTGAFQIHSVADYKKQDDLFFKRCIFFVRPAKCPKTSKTVRLSS